MCSSVVMRLCGLRKFLTPDNRLRRWYAGVRTHCAPPRSLPGVAVESGTDDGNPNIPHGSLGECGGPDSWLPNSPHFQSQVFGDFVRPSWHFRNVRLPGGAVRRHCRAASAYA
jgi:hypothetical protein